MDVSLTKGHEVAKDDHHLIRHSLVLLEVAVNEDQTGAQPLGALPRLPAVDAVCLGFVGGRQHHAAAGDH